MSEGGWKWWECSSSVLPLVGTTRVLAGGASGAGASGASVRRESVRRAGIGTVTGTRA